MSYTQGQKQAIDEINQLLENMMMTINFSNTIINLRIVYEMIILKKSFHLVI